MERANPVSQTLISAAIPVQMYETIPRCYLWIIPKGEHIPIFGERARQFQDIALAFLGGQWEQR